MGLAAKEGLEARVLGRDGTCLFRTDDRRRDRVNLYIENGKVQKAAKY